MSTKQTTRDVLQVVESGLGALAPALPGIGAPIAAALSVAAGLAADILGIGEDPVAVITEIRSSIPDFDRVKRALQERVRTRGARRTP